MSTLALCVVLRLRDGVKSFTSLVYSGDVGQDDSTVDEDNCLIPPTFSDTCMVCWLFCSDSGFFTVFIHPGDDHDESFCMPAGFR